MKKPSCCHNGSTLRTDGVSLSKAQGKNRIIPQDDPFLPNEQTSAARQHGNSGYQGSRRSLALMKTQPVLLRSGLRLFGTSTLRRCLLAGRRLLRGVRTWQR